MTKSPNIDSRPEVAAGGYARDNSSVIFYQRINALVRPEMDILDLGAGRGAVSTGIDADEMAKKHYGFSLRYLKGRVNSFTGADVDPVVMENPMLDSAHILTLGAPLPFADEQFDIVISDWVLEHIEDPEGFAIEIGRVLKPGGWFCARTPNAWGYIAIGARLAGGAVGDWILSTLQPNRQEEDVFPKYYRLNTDRSLRRAFDPGHWQHCCWRMNSTPAYFANNRLLFRLFDLYHDITPTALATTFFIFLRKRDGNANGTAQSARKNAV